jgi:hypothetical protein
MGHIVTPIVSKVQEKILNNRCRTVFYYTKSKTGTALFFTLFAIPFVLGEIFGLTMLLKVTSVTLVLFLLTAGAMHVIFIPPAESSNFCRTPADGPSGRLQAFPRRRGCGPHGSRGSSRADAGGV